MIYYASDNPNGFVTGKRYSIDEPCPTVMTSGLSAFGDYWLEGSPDMTTDPTKPPFRVPAMAEINAIPPNGLKVASTFSGCGGSCLGYRMAGYRVVWANEFVPAAQDSYRANAAEGCVLDPRDIKLVKPEEILAATGLKAGELDLLDGSPPCQAFSTAGKRAKGWGHEKAYEHGAKQCNETLFDEYIRILRGLRPRAFVAENVSGLVKGVAKGFFLEILAGLKASGYRVACRVLDAQWLGVPQCRQRAIFVGVREDLGLEPVHPAPLPYRYSVRDALPWISGVSAQPHGPNSRPNDGWSADKPACSVPASGEGAASYYKHEVIVEGPAGLRQDPATGASLELDPSRQRAIEGTNTWGSDRVAEADDPSPSIITSTNSAILRAERRKFTIAELKRICAFPDDFILTGSYAQQWERLGNSVPPVMMFHIASAIRDRVLLSFKVSPSLQDAPGSTPAAGQADPPPPGGGLAQGPSTAK